MGSSKKSSANQDYRLIIFLLVLGGLSLFLILLGRNFQSATKSDSSKRDLEEVQEQKDEGDISHFFEKDTGEQIDPFKEDCESQSVKGKSPSVFSNTVCIK